MGKSFVVLILIALFNCCLPAYAGSPAEGWEVHVTFSIDTHGNLKALRLERSSGSAWRDNGAIKAVEHAGLFDSLPDGAGDEVRFRAIFEYGCMGPSFCAIFRDYPGIESDLSWETIWQTMHKQRGSKFDGLGRFRQL